MHVWQQTLAIRYNINDNKARPFISLQKPCWLYVTWSAFDARPWAVDGQCLVVHITLVNGQCFKTYISALEIYFHSRNKQNCTSNKSYMQVMQVMQAWKPKLYS